VHGAPEGLGLEKRPKICEILTEVIYTVMLNFYLMWYYIHIGFKRISFSIRGVFSPRTYMNIIHIKNTNNIHVKITFVGINIRKSQNLYYRITNVIV
jgi:hypothetical protein